MGLKARIWALRLRYGHGGWGRGVRSRRRKGRRWRSRKFTICVKAKIIDPFRAAAQKGEMKKIG